MVRNRFVAVVACLIVVGGPQLPAGAVPTCPPDELCPAPTLAADADIMTAGDRVVLHGTAHPDTAVMLLAYSRPSTTYAVIRSSTADAAGDYEFAVAPITSSRMYVQSADGASPSVLLLVRRVVSLDVISTSGCWLTAVGSVYPQQAAVPVDIAYRAADGHFIRAMATLTGTDGSYSVGRAFGACDVTLTWRATTPTTLVNVTGVSPLRLGRLRH